MEKQPLVASEDEDDHHYGINEDSVITESDISSRNDSSVEEEARLFEDAIASTGFGKFHILLLCICGWALASDSVEIQVYMKIDLNRELLFFGLHF